MIDKLNSLEKKLEELGMLLADPAVIAEQPVYQRHAKSYRDLEPVVEKFREYKGVLRALEEVRAMGASETDPEMRKMAEEESVDLAGREEACRKELQLLLMPQDPNDDKNVLLEIRAGTGGNEATLFAAELFRMYSRFTERTGWRVEIMEGHESEVGGFKEIIAIIEGDRVYSKLKYESGVHRVQRVPETEASGRIHTSAVTVAVLPEAEEVDVQIDPTDLRIDTYRSSGAGGQHVNKTESAVRITHIPTGIVVSCQDEKSQHKNKAKAMRVLRSRILQKFQEDHDEAIASQRRSQVGTGDRSERIRTYNFPQGRVTDHRINLTLHKLPQILEGNIDELVDELTTQAQAEALGHTGS